MEYNRNAGAGRKFTEGIIISFVIMGFFMMIQFLILMAVLMGALSAYAINAGDGYNNFNATMFMYDLIKGNFMTMMTVVATSISAVFAVSFYWAAWGRRKTQQDKKYLRENVLKTQNALMLIVASIGLYYLAILISSVIAVVSPDTMKNYTEMMESALGGSEILALFAAVILAPINEECIMRGLILKNLQRFFSTPVVIIIQAVMFGLFHGNWVQGLYVLPVGAALGYVAVKSKSVLPCMVMHLFYNLLSFVVGILPDFFQTGIFAVIAVVVCAAAVWLMHTRVGKDVTAS